MAQLRQDYEAFQARNTEVVVVGPEGPGAFASFWEKESLPFIGLPDPSHSVLKLYGQQVKIFKMGRMPAQALIDMQGTVRFVHYGNSMQDIPETKENLALIDEISGELALSNGMEQ
jgi:peroxiredoxin Q/BCP